VLWDVKQLMASASPDEIRRATLIAMSDALAAGHVVAGQFLDQDEETVAFSPWNVSSMKA
jgi:hypothetical protein